MIGMLVYILQPSARAHSSPPPGPIPSAMASVNALMGALLPSPAERAAAAEQRAAEMEARANELAATLSAALRGGQARIKKEKKKSKKAQTNQKKAKERAERLGRALAAERAKAERLKEQNRERQRRWRAKRTIPQQVEDNRKRIERHLRAKERANPAPDFQDPDGSDEEEWVPPAAA